MQNTPSTISTIKSKKKKKKKKKKYNGNSKIHMGNGTGLEISHIGLSVFPSSSSPNKVFFLKNILRVRAIKKNMLNVS